MLATKADLHQVEASLREDIRRLDTKISEVKSETIKWMFLFWVGQVAVTFGFILLFLKK